MGRVVGQQPSMPGLYYMYLGEVYSVLLLHSTWDGYATIRTCC